jgi:hypothetical protein
MRRHDQPSPLDTSAALAKRCDEIQRNAEDWRAHARGAKPATACGCAPDRSDAQVVRRVDAFGLVIEYDPSKFPRIAAIDELHAALLRRQSRCSGDLRGDQICDGSR